MLDLANGNSIDGYDQLNVILGKNGSGKSTLLRLIDSALQNTQSCIRYITPERGGQLTFDGGVETARASDPNWMIGQRRKNRWEQFRQSSVAEFRNLETLVLRSIESDPEVRATDFKFDTEVERINEVLDRVQIKRSDGAGFDLTVKGSEEAANVRDLSSGESELISLAIEVLYFAYLCQQEKYANTDNWLLLDEPDVHLHPDLQHRLMSLLVHSIGKTNGRVVIATHSTSILSSLCGLSDDVRIGMKEFGAQNIVFEEIEDAMRSVLPMFGAHPLSNIFNEKPPLIVEGEDDERIWQAAFRSSQGRISIYPCVAGNVQSMNEYETAARKILESVYDDAIAHSVRDGDDTQEDEIDDVGSVRRYRLRCRSAENLIVTDEVLEVLGTDWETLQAGLVKWIEDNPQHVRHAEVRAFQASGWDRRNHPLKDLRMLIVGITGSSKPWEVATGQAIAGLKDSPHNGENCLRNFLGEKLVTGLNLTEK